MKLQLATAAAVSVLLLAGCNDNVEAEKVEAEKVIEVKTVAVTTPEQKISYVLGMNLGKQFEQGGVEVNVDVFAQAITDVQAGTAPRMSEEEMAATMQAFQTKMQAQQAEQQQAAMAERQGSADANKAAGEAFLAANAKKDGVVTLESGLQYKIVTPGTGAKPTLEAPVEVHYRGTTINGEQFDSSYDRGQPAQFLLNQVIGGWTEGLQLMSEGAKWELYIPYDLAYGAGGSGPKIGPNSALIFEVELLKAKAE